MNTVHLVGCGRFPKKLSFTDRRTEGKKRVAGGRAGGRSGDWPWIIDSEGNAGHRQDGTSSSDSPLGKVSPTAMASQVEPAVSSIAKLSATILATALFCRENIM